MSAFLHATPLAILLAVSSGCYAMNPADADTEVPRDSGTSHDAGSRDASVPPPAPDAEPDYPADVACSRIGDQLTCTVTGLPDESFFALSLACDSSESGLYQTELTAPGPHEVTIDLSSLPPEGSSFGVRLPTDCDRERTLFVNSRDGQHQAATRIDLGRR